MEALDRVVAALSDGYWHDVTELGRKVAVIEDKLGKALEFLKEYGFIHQSKGSVRLTDEMMRFQQDIKKLEN
ncbi:hypothetical protein ES702_07618 [subsurface metagenome]